MIRGHTLLQMDVVDLKHSRRVFRHLAAQPYRYADIGIIGLPFDQELCYLDTVNHFIY